MSFRSKSNPSIRAAFTAFFIFSLTALPLFSYALVLNPEFGKIQQQLYGWNGKTLVLIQEAHVDYEGQKAIVEILKTLIHQKSLRLILVEGGWDNVSLSRLRDYGDAEGRRNIADRYLKEGKISAEEYLELTSEEDLLLWGIENSGLYRKNIKAFLAFHDEQPRRLENLSKIESLLAHLKQKIFSPEFLLWDSRRLALEDQKLSLPDYLAFLRKNFPENLKTREHLQEIMALSGDGNSFDISKVELEKESLIKLLSKKIPKIETAPVLALRDEKTPDAEILFYRGLFETAGRHPEIPISFPVKNLKGYQKILEKAQAVDASVLWKELRLLETEVSAKLTDTEEQKQLQKIFRAFELLRKLFDLKLNPDDFEDFKKESAGWDFQSWADFLTAACEKHHVRSKELRLLPPVEAFIPKARAFYDSAVERENALIQNTARQMEHSPESVAAVITGGFHSESLIKAFHEKGYSVISVVPRFNPEDSGKSQKKYFEMLKYRSGN